MPPDRLDPGAARAGTTVRLGRVLLVDDDADLLETMASLLENHDVVTVGDAQRALSILGENPDFDVIVSDVVMPGMSGVTFRSVLAGSQPRLAERIVFMTGGGSSADDELVLASGEVAVLRKPFTLDDLTTLVEARVAALRGRGE